MTNKTVYIFVRQDISSEQQLVQAAHATFKAGMTFKEKCDPDITRFVVIGVSSLIGLYAIEQIAEAFSINFVAFSDPDIFPGESPPANEDIILSETSTAICLEPLNDAECLPFKAFKTLRFPRAPV